MGWWGANDQGHSLQPDGELLWGDGPADAMDQALDLIEAEFREQGRKPTLAELQSGLLFSFNGRKDEALTVSDDDDRPDHPDEHDACPIHEEPYRICGCPVPSA